MQHGTGKDTTERRHLENDERERKYSGQKAGVGVGEQQTVLD